MFMSSEGICVPVAAPATCYAVPTITLADRQRSKLAAYDYFLTRAAERAGNAEVRGKHAKARRYNRLQAWLKARLANVKAQVQHGPIDRSKFITDRIQYFHEKGFSAGQPVQHKTGTKGVVVPKDCESGWLTVNTEHGTQLWRISETRKRVKMTAAEAFRLM